MESVSRKTTHEDPPRENIEYCIEPISWRKHIENNLG
jgi:hypothetical protein